MAAAGGLSVAADDKPVEKIDVTKLIGKWEPKEAKEPKLVIEFAKGGKLSITVTGKGKDAKLDGTYKIDGNKLVTTVKFGEKERSRTLTVTRLTATEMVSTDDEGKGKEETLIRIKDK
jgi:uncharacterized protein (TIGR03066 family)